MAITVEQRTAIIELVVGMFGAAPGANVLSDLVAAYEAGSSLKQIAANLAKSDQFKGIFPTFMTNGEFATKVVDQLVGSSVVAAEKAAAVTLLTAQLNSGKSRSDVFVDAISALNAVASTNAAWGNAAVAFDNKVAAAVYYSVDKQLSGASLAALQAVVSSVTNSTASLDAAKAAADAAAAPSQTFTLTADAPSVTETDGEARVLTFTLKLNKAPTKDLVISYDVDASSTAKLGDDFTVKAGTVTFAAGQTSAEVQVTVLPDDLDEANESIVLNFTNKETLAAPYTSVKLVNDLKATGTIIDDDASFVFTSSAANIVAENTTAVVTVAGADADSASGLTTTLTGADAALFSLTNGALAFKAAPNFEAPADAGKDNVYNVSINVADASGNATTQNLVITVSDANEAPTALALTGQVASIAENTVLTASRKVADIVVTDDALGTETFTVGGADAANFEIVGTELHLKAGTALNFEAKSAYNVTVSAADATLTGSTPVTAAYALAVTNVNEAPVAAADTAVVITGNSVTIPVLANDTDVDAGTTLAISGTPTASVGTVAVSGGQLVYTAPNGFQGAATINYTVTDGALTSSSTATVNVGEPLLTRAAASVNEGQSVVFSVKGVANTEYSIQLDETGMRAAEAVDGIVKVTTNATGDATLTLPTIVDRTTDGAQSVRANIVGTLATPVTVTVVDTSLNNVAPVATSATLAIAEGAAAVTGQLVATDADAADVANLTFSTASVVPGFTLSANGSYSFDATNAAYNTLAVGQTSVRTVAFTVSDNATTAGGGARTATGTLTITVTGTNDAPVVTVANATPTVTENTTLVTTFATSDVDAGDTLSRVTLGGEEAALFQIVDATGRLEFRTAPDFEAPTDANRDGIYNVTLNVTDNNGVTSTRAVVITVADGPEAARVFNLTGGGDAGVAFTGDTGNDTFNALETTNNAGAVIPTWTVGDAINGGLGNDVFNITQAAAIANPLGATVTGIETLNAISGATITLNTTAFTGLTALNTTSVGGTGAGITAAATTAVTATNTGAGAVTLIGGASQTVNTAVNVVLSGSVGAVSSTSSAMTGASTINGGTSVTVVNSGVTAAGTLVIGGTAAPTGAVSVTSTSSAVDTTVQGTIAVTGGTTVNINQVAGNAVLTTTTAGAVTVTGGTATTAVTVNNSALATQAATVVGRAGGTVTIADGNAATASDTITTVTLSNYGNSTVESNVLSTVNLSSTGANASGTLGLNVGAVADTSVVATTLNLNMAGGSVGAIAGTQAALYTTINVNSSAASTIANLTAPAATTLNVSGAGVTTFTAQTLGAVTAINSTGGGLTLGTALGTGVTFTGGAGTESVILGATTRAITMGDGNDTVTYGGAAGVGGSVSGGNGTDTIIMTDAQADAADASAAFNATFTGFEVLQLSTLAAGSTIDLAGVGGLSNVRVGTGGTVTLNNMASGGTYTLTATSTAATIGVTNALFNAADVLNLALAGNIGAVVGYGTVTAANVETVNIAATDSAAAGSAAAINTLTLAATSATSVVVTGNNGLNLTNTGNVAITNFDASGVVGNGTADLPANLAVTFLSANVAGAVTIRGGAGNDSLTGVGGIDTIIGGAGNDIIGGAGGADVLTGGEGADVITGGAGNDTIDLTETTAAIDTVVFAATAAAANGIDTITGFAAGAGIDIVRLGVATTANTATGTAAVVGTPTNTTLTAGATAFALTGASSTTSDVIEVTATLSSFGNLAATGVVDGTELLKALSSVNVAATSITATTAGDDFYIVAYQGGNAYLYEVTNDANTVVLASEIALVGVFNGIAAGAFAAGDFVTL